MSTVTYADWDLEDYSIEREEDVTYVLLDRKDNVVMWGYCMDGIGILWEDTREELEESYEIDKIVYYYKNQLQD